jgi:hypothetical protein
VGGAGAPACTPVALADPAPLRRLTRTQYVNVLKDVVKAWAPTLADQVMAAAAVTAALQKLPDDGRVTGTSEAHGGFRRLHQNVQQEHADAALTIAQAVAVELTSSTAKLGSLMGTCATDTNTGNDVQCVRTFVQKAARFSDRRPPATEDVDFYVSVYGATGINAAALADVLVVMLNSPYLFFQVEHGDAATAEDPKVFKLTADELANRLSLQFMGTMPDDALRALADSGRILADDGYAEALAHVSGAPAAKTVMTEFFREYMSLEDLLEMDRFSGAAQFDAVRGNFTPGPTTRESMIDEATNLAVYYAQKPDGTFADLLTSKKSFATTADVATLHGQSGLWSGQGEPPNMTQPERVGMLTHAALVATGGPVTRPIQKGVFIRRTLMCDPVPPPPSNAMDVATKDGSTLAALLSTRARTEGLTEKRADCAGCHQALINPLGFVSENFDPLGRLRQMETVFSETGTNLGQVAVNTSAVPQVVGGDKTMAANAIELQQQMLASQKPQECFARKYFRFTFSRLEDNATDGCLLQVIKSDLVTGKPLGQTLFNLAKTPTFKVRRFN